ncbi:hypothetical protein NM208_g10215 [Fusarium decemcellulare]|uniref:Uncharacterized protein n=1 Tax=Fusarium decemcellulare TaxID=57161 RepID=A0ACC1RYM7_9HYPO|nr:hypothetical protein NM208_g10215 [Fusarium decemcellulare]
MPHLHSDLPGPVTRPDVPYSCITPTSDNISPSSDQAVSPTSSAPDQQSTQSETSWSDGPAEFKHAGVLGQRATLNTHLRELFDENIFAKPCRSAIRGLQGPNLSSTGRLPQPIAFPEIVLQQGTKSGQWELREADFWTCGFFPGTLYALLERCIRYPGSLTTRDDITQLTATDVRTRLLPLCKSWSEPLHAMSNRTDTHDIGFIVMPALQREWELFGDQRSLDSIVQAAHSLVTRYIPTAGAIRSWDCLLKKDITVTDMTDNLLIIIDSMCNLDLLFYAAAHTGEHELADIAATHARTLLKTHLRPERVRSLAKDGYKGQLYSTCHVANIAPQTGDLKWRWTAQGYANDSTWSRGQAWAILGYIQTYKWTKDDEFLEAACGVAEYFLHRLDTSPSCVEVSAKTEDQNSSAGRRIGRHVPLWDFDAPIQNPSEPLRDSSAGVIAANGMLLLSQALKALNQHTLAHRFFEAAIEIVKDTLDLSLAEEKAVFEKESDRDTTMGIKDTLPGRTFEAILKHGTANNNENARRRYSNHGLVYGDYYLVEFGNRLLSMGFA